MIQAEGRKLNRLPTSPSVFLLAGKVLGLGFLMFLVLMSAMAVVYVKHLNRSLHIELQQSQRKRDHLHVEWSRLLLEQGALASDVRVEQVAREQLGMIIPSPTTIEVMRP